MGDGDKLRVIVLTHGGVERALARLLALDVAHVAGVFVETNTTPRRRRRTLREQLQRSIRYEGLAATCAKPLRKIAGRFRRSPGTAVRDPYSDLRELAGRHGVPVRFVADFHAPDSMASMRAASPDLGVVYGTNILKPSVFAIPRLGSINLHQALVPYYRGGPVLFWELFNGERTAGITVHTVAEQVDAGHVVVQETLPLEYDFYAHGLDFDGFIQRFREERMADLSARLIADAVRMFAEGTARPWPQDLSLGTRYRLPTKKEKDELRRRLRDRRDRAARGVPDAHTIQRTSQ